MNTTYKSNNNVVYSCKYHVVWCPKYRRKVLINGVDVRLKELLTEYAANLSVDILEMEIMPDHVHMLLEVDPQFGIHKAVKSFKGYTSRILRQEFPYLKTKMPTLWTNSCRSDCSDTSLVLCEFHFHTSQLYIPAFQKILPRKHSLSILTVYDSGSSP